MHTIMFDTKNMPKFSEPDHRNFGDEKRECFFERLLGFRESDEERGFFDIG